MRLGARPTTIMTRLPTPAEIAAMAPPSSGDSCNSNGEDRTRTDENDMGRGGSGGLDGDDDIILPARTLASEVS
jgi:hypothetical protein